MCCISCRCKGCQGAAPCCVLLQVYANLQPKAHFLQLLQDGAGLKAAWEAFRAMEAAIGVLTWYYALNGISILLLIARCVLAGLAWGWCSEALAHAVLKHATTCISLLLCAGCCGLWTSSPDSGL